MFHFKSTLAALDHQLFLAAPQLQQVYIDPMALSPAAKNDLALVLPRHCAVPRSPLSLTIARLDQLHCFISGNKWPKMRKWWAQFCAGSQETGVVKIPRSMGGAHSNHLVAFAAVGQALGVPVGCYVRANGQGAQLLPTPTLTLLDSLGALITPVSRSDFRRLRDNHTELHAPESLQDSFDFLPEGGRSLEAAASVGAWVEHQQAWLHAFNTVYVGCGTGTWLAGLVHGFAVTGLSRHVIGVPAVAGEKWLAQDIAQLLKGVAPKQTRLNKHWALDWSYPLPGFVPVPAEQLQALVRLFQCDVDPVYMPRILHVVLNRWCAGSLGPNPLVIHGGGLQANGSETVKSVQKMEQLQ